MRFTKSARKEIVEEFASRHHGVFNAEEFLREVEAKGADHPAHGWFSWDNAKAADEFRIDQARAFIRDLKISFTIQEIGRTGSITVKTIEAPLAISPLDGRANGGGYRLLNPNSEESKRQLCGEAASSMKAFKNRFEAAVIFADADPALIDDIIARLEAKAAGRVIDQVAAKVA